jgi:hypothetical protein
MIFDASRRPAVVVPVCLWRKAGIRNAQSPGAIAPKTIPLIIFHFPDLHFATVSIIWNTIGLSSEIPSRRPSWKWRIYAI